MIVSTLLFLVLQATSRNSATGCEYPNVPLLTPHNQSYIYCNPLDVNYTCPGEQGTYVCQYRWLGLSLCCIRNGSLQNLHKSVGNENQRISGSASQLKPRDPVLRHSDTPIPRPPTFGVPDPGPYHGGFAGTTGPVGSDEPAEIAPHRDLSSQKVQQLFRRNVDPELESLIFGVNHNKREPKIDKPINRSINNSNVSIVASKLSRNNSKAITAKSNTMLENSNLAGTGSFLDPRIILLQQGAWLRIDETSFNFPTTVTLVQDGPVNIIVDTGTVRDSERILKGLKKLRLDPTQVHFVVLSHGHPDHFGNTGLFPKSIHFFGTFKYEGARFTATHLLMNDTLQITSHVTLYRTPGHTPQDITTVVRRSNDTIAIVGGSGSQLRFLSGVDFTDHLLHSWSRAPIMPNIVGDLFANASDLETEDIWTIVSADPTRQLRSRKLIACIADYIVPGHGRLFPVTKQMKSKFNCSLNS